VAQLVDNNGAFDPRTRYEPGGRGFKSCRARQIIKYLASPARLAFSCCATFAPLLIHRNALPSRIRDAQNSACSAALQDQIRLLDQVTDIGAGVMAGHGMMGVAEEGFPIFGRYAGRTQTTGKGVPLIPMPELAA
jgi:hypothetical protein